MSTFKALIAPFGIWRELDAEMIGQLAIHTPVFVDDANVSLTISHAASGHYIWVFEEWVSQDEIRRLATLLLTQDFDAYYAGGCKDRVFVAECKRLFAEWEAAIPNRLEWDHVSLDQHVSVEMAS